MRCSVPFLIGVALSLAPVRVWADLAYRFDIVSAFASATPFSNRIDSLYTEPRTGYVQIVNAGPGDYRGIVRTVAISEIAGDLGFDLEDGFIPAGGSVSIAIAYDSSNVGGFNGPAYHFNPGVIIYLEGTVSDGTGYGLVKAAIQDLDLHSGVFRTDDNGLVTDNFVLQGGDPFGFQNSPEFQLSQAWGHGTLQGLATPEPRSAWLLTLPAAALLLARRQRWQIGRVRVYTRW
jgi:hypothetical protein